MANKARVKSSKSATAPKKAVALPVPDNTTAKWMLSAGGGIALFALAVWLVNWKSVP